MLKELHIRNFTLIKQADLAFENGMTVLTGETGAGKSILISALGLLLGDRAEPKQVFQNTGKADISGVFQVNDTAQSWLESQDLNHDEACIIRRVIYREGRSKAYINGSPATVSQLKSLGQRLLKIHAQHEHHALLRREYQLARLDHYANHAKRLAQVSKAFDHWQQTSQQVETLKIQQEQQLAKHSLLRYQQEELATLNLKANELEERHQQQKNLSHAQQLMETCTQAIEALDESDQSIIHQLSHWQKTLSKLPVQDKRLTNILKSAEEALISLEEMSSGLQDYGQNLSLDPKALSTIEARLNQIYDIARKQQIPTEQLYEHGLAVGEQLTSFGLLDQDIERLEKQLETAHINYQKHAKSLQKSRSKAAKQLSPQVNEILDQLGIKSGQFEVHFNTFEQPKALGIDNIEFLVSTNPGQPLQSMNDVVSGGELSRISLAIQVLTAEQQSTPSLVFDEVDVGIGGGIAEVVGTLLRQLGEHCQVLCITHLAQVAAQGHAHLHINKQVGQQAQTHIQQLDEENRLQEIARMLGGVIITEQTRKHAKEMLDVRQN